MSFTITPPPPTAPPDFSFKAQAAFGLLVFSIKKRAFRLVFYFCSRCKVNVVPCPSLLSTVMGMCSSSAARRVRYSPSPLALRSSRPFCPVYPFSKMRGRSSGAMPMPVSLMRSHSPSIATVTPPSGVYLMALESSCSSMQQNHFLSVTMVFSVAT